MGARRNRLVWLSLVGMGLCFGPGVLRWVGIALMVLPFVALAIWRKLDPPPPFEVITIDGEGVTRAFANGKSEHIAWKDLTEVSILTTSGGPYVDDFFWVLLGEGSGCFVPGPLAAGLMGRLQRLPGFDNEQVLRSVGSVTEAHFLCWKGKAGEGLLAAAPNATEPPTPKPFAPAKGG